MLRYVVVSIMAVALFVALLFWGSVPLPASDVWDVLRGVQSDNSVAQAIVLGVRLPMALVALSAGVALAVAGLIMQTVFANALAGPSVLGVSSGASLGVAVVLLGCGGAVGFGFGQYMAALAGALAGAVAVLVLLLVFSAFLRSNAMLLIFGILVGYLASSGIALLNFFSTQQGVHSYVIWGMGNFSGVGVCSMLCLLVFTIVGFGIALMFVKPLNALLLGERYAASMGVGVKATRNCLLALSGLLTAAVTACCGPIAFLGLVMPHVARFIFRTSNHRVLLPAAALVGGVGAMGCALLSVVCGGGGIIPINAITPVISVPVIVYIIVKRKSL